MIFIKDNEWILKDENPQSFSATDLSTKDKVGVVFPLKRAKEALNTASIVDLRDGYLKLAHSEARLCTSDEAIKYKRGFHISYVKGYELEFQNTLAKRLAGHGIKTKITFPSYLVTDRVSSLSPEIKELLTFFESKDYKADTSFIKEKNLTKKQSPRTLMPLVKFKQLDFAKGVEHLKGAISKINTAYAPLIDEMTTREDLLWLYNFIKEEQDDSHYRYRNELF